MLKYPIILAHGIAVTDKATFFNFWGRIPEALRNVGCKLYFGQTDAWNSYKINAEKLKNSIDEALKETGADKVNIIAHSKGGIDARYLIKHYGYNDKVASLTTLGTPHHGAELADLFLTPNMIHTETTQKLLSAIGKMFKDENPDPYTSVRELTLENMAEFNKNVPVPDRVHVSSYFSRMIKAYDDILFVATHTYLHEYHGDSDGVVTVKSADWGPRVKEIKGKTGGISHSGLVDRTMIDISGINITEEYLKIVEELKSLGF